MTVIYTGHPSDIYRKQLLDLLEAPEVWVRDRPTRELLNVITEVSPLDVVQIVPGRKLNPWLALSEGLALIAGSDQVKHLEPYNRRIKDFSDDGKTFYGSYAARIRDQIPALLWRLGVRGDRRAVLAIWERRDLVAETKDPPCNDMLMFKVRDEKLFMSVHCRSNDLHWGLHAVNLPEFAILQQYLAMHLEVGLGTQTHWSDSLHIYTDGPQQELTKNMLAALDEPIFKLEQPFLFPHNSIGDHSRWQETCYAILDKSHQISGPPFLTFAQQFLATYRHQPIDWAPWADTDRMGKTAFSAWVKSGLEFIRDPQR